MNTSLRRRNESVLVWSIKIIAGLLIIFLLGLHFVVNHLVAPGGLLSYADVVAYYNNPIIPIIEGFFLVFILVHCLLGLRSIVIDLNPSPRVLLWVNWLLVIIGIAATTYGIWLLVAVSNAG